MSKQRKIWTIVFYFLTVIGVVGTTSKGSSPSWIWAILLIVGFLGLTIFGWPVWKKMLSIK